jgi:hypothetical protein
VTKVQIFDKTKKKPHKRKKRKRNRKNRKVKKILPDLVGLQPNKLPGGEWVCSATPGAVQIGL